MVRELCPVMPQPFVGPYLVYQKYGLFPLSCPADADLQEAQPPCLFFHIYALSGPGENAIR